MDRNRSLSEETSADATDASPGITAAPIGNIGDTMGGTVDFTDPVQQALILDRYLGRLRHLSESQRLAGDTLEVIRACLGSQRLSAWLTDDQKSGYRLVASLGHPGGTTLPDALPDALERLFPTHIDLDAPVGLGLAPLVLPVAPRADRGHLDAQLLVTLPGPQIVQGVLLLGARAGGLSYDPAMELSLRQIALELGRTLTHLGRTHGGPPPAASRVKAPATFTARLEEELARAERFKRDLTVLWIAIDVPSVVERDGETAVSALVDAVGAWLATTLRVMDSIGRHDRALVAALPETTRAGADLLKARLGTLAADESFGLSRVARTRLRLRVGMAGYPDEGVSSRFLLLAAERHADEEKVEADAGATQDRGPLAVHLVEPQAVGRQPVATSARMRAVLELAKRVAPSKLTVLVTGETGVGKERIAEFIHNNSDRRDKPEVSLNCSAIPETMIEAEFFGFERGSFTGAVRSTRGKFELADGGTLFLDEIGELSMAMQVKLLRVLDEQRFYRLGAAVPTQVDVRVIAITNRDLSQDVVAGRFREDLFYRLNVVTIKIPPLRERPEDIPALVDRLIGEFCERTSLPLKKLGVEAYDLLYSYPWRGNVRELRNVIERSMVVSTGSYITGDDLIHAVPELAAIRAPVMRPAARSIDAMKGGGELAAGSEPRMLRTAFGHEREDGVLDLIRRHPDIGLQDILRELGASKSTGIRLVNELIARGQVVRRERGKRSRYRIAEPKNA